MISSTTEMVNPPTAAMRVQQVSACAPLGNRWLQLALQGAIADNLQYPIC